MTYGALTPGELAPFERGTRITISQPVLCAVALTLSATIGLWMLYGPAAAPDHSTASLAPLPAAAPAKPRSFAALRAQARVDVPPAILPLRHYAAMLDPNFTGGHAPLTFAQSAPLRAGFEPLRRGATPLAAPLVADALGSAKRSTLVASLPLPAAKPALTLTGRPAMDVPAVPVESDVDEAASAPAPTPAVVAALPTPMPRPTFPFAGRTHAHRGAEQPEAAPAPMAPGVPAPVQQAEAKPSFFDKFFGAMKPSNALAYASPEDGGLLGAPGAPDRYTAVYNITTHTVTLPDGSRLEAHSGLGPHVDNPASVALRMRGATPPNLYDLTVREAPFHGVRALRMTPLGGTTYGRAGLLTHNYMLRGGLAESNGCVVFKNYPAFLAAYDRGQVRRLRVIAGI